MATTSTGISLYGVDEANCSNHTDGGKKTVKKYLQQFDTSHAGIFH